MVLVKVVTSLLPAISRYRVPVLVGSAKAVPIILASSLQFKQPSGPLLSVKAQQLPVRRLTT